MNLVCVLLSCLGHISIALCDTMILVERLLQRNPLVARRHDLAKNHYTCQVRSSRLRLVCSANVAQDTITVAAVD